ncbi:type II toxin-antitoxin system RelE/ParE family toxin [Thiohalocapsa sp. ML1]|jgi:plasmid stabilization system protein ParE|uniref:type II toxin-antitoxin system RelE/ParE family toxin n=1 Tax=Thiohalocapsa sp. ML1 TaxID=1431688 RepID=UPI000731F7A1|nr:type II toxin-antitoxin system RelE/ParE family toxin [Thiohalocapsa sp. ML1]
MKVRELTVALAELDAALGHYRDIDPRLAAALLAEVDAAKQAIRRFPSAWKRFRSGVRGFTLRRFPYTIIYQATDDEILIVAYAHQRRQPQYWLKRV